MNGGDRLGDDLLHPQLFQQEGDHDRCLHVLPQAHDGHIDLPDANGSEGFLIGHIGLDGMGSKALHRRHLLRIGVDTENLTALLGQGLSDRISEISQSDDCKLPVLRRYSPLSDQDLFLWRSGTWVPVAWERTAAPTVIGPTLPAYMVKTISSLPQGEKMAERLQGEPGAPTESPTVPKAETSSKRTGKQRLPLDDHEEDGQ